MKEALACFDIERKVMKNCLYYTIEEWEVLECQNSIHMINNYLQISFRITNCSHFRFPSIQLLLKISTIFNRWRCYYAKLLNITKSKLLESEDIINETTKHSDLKNEASLQ